jgi:hypothetical protein
MIAARLLKRTAKIWNALPSASQWNLSFNFHNSVAEIGKHVFYPAHFIDGHSNAGNHCRY